MSLLAFLGILSLMMVLHEMGHFITAKMAGITVQEFGIFLPPRIWGFRFRGVLYSINAIPFGAFVKMLGEGDSSDPGSFAQKPRWVRAIVLSAGSGMNFLLAVVAFSIAFMVGIPTATTDGPVRLAGIAPDSPASMAGLQDGDVVLAFDGEQLNDSQRFRDLTQQHLGTAIQLTVQHATSGELSTLALTPRLAPPQGQGALGVVLSANTRIVQTPVFQAVAQGFQQTVRAIGFTFLIPKLLMDGVITPSDARPIGLPGMAQLTSQTVDVVVNTGLWFPLFMLTGMFSAGLSVANMLPIPALDGGRLLFVFIEWIRGRRIPPEREAAFHVAGIVSLLVLMVVISVNDVISPIPVVNWGIR